MNRKEIKKNAFNNFKRNYLKIILVVFIVGIIVNGGYQYSSIMTNSNSVKEISDSKIVNNGYQLTKVINENTININNQNTSNFQLVNNLVDTLSDKISTGGHASGVIGSLFNSVTQSNSIVIGSLNAINLYLLNNKK